MRPKTLAERLHLAAQEAERDGKSRLEQPPYAPEFAEWLAYRFAQITPPEVAAALDAEFPQPDYVDCDYLTQVLVQIEQTKYCEREVGCGVDFVFGGIEYSAQKAARAREWLAAARSRQK